MTDNSMTSPLQSLQALLARCEEPCNCSCNRACGCDCHAYTALATNLLLPAMEYVLAEDAFYARPDEPPPFGHDCHWCGACVTKLRDMRVAVLHDLKEAIAAGGVGS